MALTNAVEGHRNEARKPVPSETDELRKRLKSSQSVLSQSSPIAMLTAAAELGVHSTGNAVGLDLTPQSQSPPASYAETSVPSLSLGPPLPQVECTPGERASDPTVPRTLDGVEVTGEEIDEIFQLYTPNLR
ncbi:unnamed protein product [Aspergillus oryzae]|uniref:Unnamed protein product n=2 Tax=Aspergillus oryzae TaxID=5062 RepID=A0AAN5BXK2_ASPOZ|nr:unnamed protein product [Aspergillus oryzae]GMG01857.1 unnamed protein product [Aspergillus oryzae]GMG30729.1 unnamed protein product [Aspergillus oryzae]